MGLEDLTHHLVLALDDVNHHNLEGWINLRVEDEREQLHQLGVVSSDHLKQLNGTLFLDLLIDSRGGYIKL